MANNKSCTSNTCIVFDFDCTLTNEHLYYLLHDTDNFIKMYNIRDKTEIYDMANTIKSIYSVDNTKIDCDIILPKSITKKFIDTIFGGSSRIKILDKFLKKCIKQNIDLYISSRGYLRDIITSLKITNLLKYFKSIHSTLDKTIYQIDNQIKTIDYNSGKEFFILNILNHYTNVLYIDDTLTEHERLKNIFVLKNSGTGYELYSTLIDNVTKYYAFINTLTKNGSGIATTEIDIIKMLINKLV